MIYSPPQIIKSNSDTSTLLAGFGAAEITPILDTKKTSKKKNRLYYSMAGYRFGRIAKSVHDPLWAKTVLLQKNNITVAIVTLDLIGFQYDDVEAIQNTLPPEWNINYLVINSTHTHHGPDTLGLWGQTLRPTTRKHYFKYLKQQILTSIEKALKNRQPTEIYTAQKSIKHLNLVQDLRPPHIFSDNLTVFQFRNQEKILGTIIHWACHPESLEHHNTALSSDFPHYLREEVQDQTKAPAIYWNGAIGGLLVPAETININGKTYSHGSFQFAEALGRTVGNTAANLSQNSTKINVENLSVHSQKFQFIVKNLLFKTGFFLGLFKRKLAFNRFAKTEVATIQIGEWTIQTIPGEIFPELIEGPLSPPKYADFPQSPKEEPVLAEIVKNKFCTFLGLAQDELGYIIPLNSWDRYPPFIGKGKMASYGEALSPNRKLSLILHEVIERLNKIAEHNGTTLDAP